MLKSLSDNYKIENTKREIADDEKLEMISNRRKTKN